MTMDPRPEDAAQDAAAYRQALGGFATGVCVVTADAEGGPLGITINSFTSVSLEPRLVLWCLDEGSERWSVFAAAERFAVHVLPAQGRAMAARFARGVCVLGPDEFSRPDDGPPVLPGALVRFDCAVHQRIPMGDHLIVVGRVLAFDGPGDSDALTFYRGGYGTASHVDDQEQS